MMRAAACVAIALLALNLTAAQEVRLPLPVCASPALSVVALPHHHVGPDMQPQ